MRTLSIIAVIAATATSAMAERDTGDFTNSSTASVNEQGARNVTTFDLNGPVADSNAKVFPGGPGDR